MPDDNVELTRTAYEAYARGDLATMIGFVDPDPRVDVPRSQPGGPGAARVAWPARTRGGPRAPGRARPEVGAGGGHRERRGGDAGRRTPGVDAYRVRPAEDRNFTLLTVRDSRIVAIRESRDRTEALAVGASNR
jgi:ketosteroid isomerase-like protein